MSEQSLDPTIRYRRENEYVKSLPKFLIKGTESGRRRHPWLRHPTTVLKIIYTIARYIVQIFQHRRKLVSLFRVRRVKRSVFGLLIGNGPSQGYLNCDLLRRFRELGGEIFAVNYWQENSDLSIVRPDYLIISDPRTLSDEEFEPKLKNKNEKLSEYLKSNVEVKIICPLSRRYELEKKFGVERIICFVDLEMPVGSNINPMFPRGYLSMTLFKALAMATWFGYRGIFVIGMDNTYPRNIYCDRRNRVLNLEIHAGEADYVVDQTECYRSISRLLMELSRLFRDAEKFRTEVPVVNVDEYSLTDAFPKVEFSLFETFKTAEDLYRIIRSSSENSGNSSI